jgi:hypothetical protein
MEPWSKISKCMDYINEQTFLLPDLLSLVIEFAFETDVFNNFHNLFKRKCYKSRPVYPIGSRAKFTALGFVYQKIDGERAAELEVLIGDLCGYFYITLDNPEKWIFYRQDRCTLLDAIITQSQTPKNVREASLQDAQMTIYRMIIPQICAHVARCRLSCK